MANTSGSDIEEGLLHRRSTLSHAPAEDVEEDLASAT
jgi:hypothetical protein